MAEGNGVAAQDIGAAAVSDQHLATAPLRLLIIADNWGPTQEISFAAPLKRWRDAGAAAISAFDERILAKVRKERGQAGVEAFIATQFGSAKPTALILSRFGGVDYKLIIAEARRRGVPIVFHMDDDILEAPIALGAEIYRRYRFSRRLHAFYRIVEEADVVYVSTPELGKRLLQHSGVKDLFVGEIYTGADVAAVDGAAPASATASPPKRDGEIRVGYMGSAGHAFDFEYVLEPIHALLRNNENVTFHLLGSISVTDVAKEFGGDRVVVMPNVPGTYWDFRKRLPALGWDIGLAPLRANEFNNCKAPTKWVEYSEAGIAVLASDGPVYERMGREGAARLCAPDAWDSAIEELVKSAESRASLVQKSRDLLAREFSWRRVEEQVLDLVATLGKNGALGSA
jgi:glycosyltransferase involved in cell wall biosynthesis